MVAITLDSSAAIELFKGNTMVAETLRNSESCYVPVTAIRELTYGALNSRQTGKHLKLLKEFTASTTVLPITSEVAEAYAEVKLKLKQGGTPIPENDIWIAAITIVSKTHLLIFTVISKRLGNWKRQFWLSDFS